MNNPHTSLAKLFVEDALWRPGPPATIVRELGQVRKEAAAADDLCAGMWLGLHPNFLIKTMTSLVIGEKPPIFISISNII